MRILLLQEDYSEFLSWFYENNRGLVSSSFQEQYEHRLATYFGGTVRFLFDAFRNSSHETWLLFPNNEPMQRAWAEEKGVRISQSDRVKNQYRRVRNLLSGFTRRLPAQNGKLQNKRKSWYYKTLRAQISSFEPDVIVNMGLTVDQEFLNRVTKNDVTLVGTVGLPSLHGRAYENCDLVISHLPGEAEKLRENGIPAALVRHSFGRRVLEELETGEQIPISFVGGLTTKHSRRIELLEHVCQELPVQVWAPDLSHLARNSPIRGCYQGQAWGLGMYNILSRSHVTLNSHVDGVDVAANVRLFEATGAGTALVTDELDGLAKLFEPKQEVLTYNTAEECVASINQLLDNPDQREKLANAGQQRTLSEHTGRERRDSLLQAIGEYCYS